MLVSPCFCFVLVWLPKPTMGLSHKRLGMAVLIVETLLVGIKHSNPR